MKNKDMISVVIPVYNVEKYLRKCVDSILRQTYTNLEIILVDDGSPDNCGTICDEYGKLDKRVKVIHKENGGLSDARNVGINISSGGWLAFIDSDDYVSNDYIETLYSLVRDNNSDIGIVMPLEVDENYIVKNCKNKDVVLNMNSETALVKMLYQKFYDTSAWGKLYRRDLFDCVKFPVGKIYEDISTVYKTFLKCNQITFMNTKKYYYLQRKDSIMGQSFKIKDMDYVYQAEVMLKDIFKTKNKVLIDAAICRYVNANFSILLKMGKKYKGTKEYNALKKNIKQYQYKVLFNKDSRFKTKVAILLNYFNFF